MQGAWKVGLLVVVFAGLLVSLLAFLGASFGKKEVQVFQAKMPDAGGILPGSKLLMAGVQIGIVRSVSLESPSVARLTLDIQKGVRIPRGSVVRIPSALISLGENSVTVVPGPGPDLMDPATDVLIGRKETMLESSLPEVNDTLVGLQATMKEVQALMGNVSKVLTDESRLAKVDQLLTTIDGTVAKFGNVAGRLDGLMAQNQSKLVGALDSFKTAMKDVQGTTSLVAEMIREGKFDEKVNSILVNLDKTTGKASSLVDEMKELVTDPKLRDPLAKSVQDMATITESGTRMAADAEKMAQNGVKITEKVDKFADKANELADNAKDIFEQIKKIIGRSPSTDRLNLTANLDLVRESKPGHTRTDIEAAFNIGQNRLHAGIYDAFEKNKITLQVGRPFWGGKGEIRYGVYASKPGIGVEYEIARGLSLRGDLFDMNNPRADLRARFDLGGGFYGWLGAQQLFKRNTLLVGVGFKVK